MRKKMSEFRIRNRIKLDPISRIDQCELYCLIDTNREYLGKYLRWVESTNSKNDLDNFIISSENLIKNNTGANFKVTYDDKFIGIISIFINDEKNKIFEIGYWLSLEFSNKGIMSECVKKVEEIIINNYDANKIELRCAVENLPSNKVAINNNYAFVDILTNYEEIMGRKLDYNRYAKCV
jgi:ribosomal-protein-serine acetyltransferase